MSESPTYGRLTGERLRAHLLGQLGDALGRFAREELSMQEGMQDVYLNALLTILTVVTSELVKGGQLSVQALEDQLLPHTLSKENDPKLPLPIRELTIKRFLKEIGVPSKPTATGESA